MQFLTITRPRSASERHARARGPRGEFYAFDCVARLDTAIEDIGVRFDADVEQYDSREYWPDFRHGVRLGGDEARKQGTRFCSIGLLVTRTEENPVDTSYAVVLRCLHEFTRSRIVSLAEPVPPLHPDWLTSDVVALARGIAAGGAADGLPALTDALLEAGCDHPLALEHLRTCPDHGTSCWVVEMICTQAAARDGR